MNRVGNLIAIAVGLILALAFADVVAAFAENIVTPIIAAIGGKPGFAALNARAADGWEVVASTDAGVIMKR